MIEQLEQLTDEFERQLRAAHPRLAEYLDMTILARPVWGGGFDVCGELYATKEQAEEAQRAAVMQILIEVNERRP